MVIGHTLVTLVTNINIDVSNLGGAKGAYAPGAFSGGRRKPFIITLLFYLTEKKYLKIKI